MPSFETGARAGTDLYAPRFLDSIRWEQTVQPGGQLRGVDLDWRAAMRPNGNDYAGIAFAADGTVWGVWADPRANENQEAGIAIARFRRS